MATEREGICLCSRRGCVTNPHLSMTSPRTPYKKKQGAFLCFSVAEAFLFLSMYVYDMSPKTYPPINKLNFRPVRHTSPAPLLNTMLNSEALFCFFSAGYLRRRSCQHCFEGGTGESEQAEVKFVDGLTAQMRTKFSGNQRHKCLKRSAATSVQKLSCSF